MEEFKYLGTTLENKNSIQEDIKSRLNLVNDCYYSVNREERRLRVFENRVLRRVFGTKRNEVTG